MFKIFRTISIFVLIFLFKNIKAQSCSDLNAGTVSTTPICLDFDAATPASGSSVCAGPGHGGSGSVRVIRFCTGSTVQCVQFTFSGLSASNGTSFALYSSCSGGFTLSGLVSGSGACDGSNSSPVYTTSGLTLAPSTCYFLRVWTKDAPTSSSTVCIQTNPATNDYCTSASLISPTAISTNNYCMTAGSNGSYTEPPASQFCAGSLENNAWYTFYASPSCTSPCTVVVNITGITCSGGASGFQIGFWSGSCSSLSYLGCTSGSGGSVTATITGLSPGQQILIGIDGNAGANCSFSISATNSSPLPIKLADFKGININNTNEIQWATISEFNNDYFTVEKSLDGQFYSYLEKVKGSENSNSIIEYKIVDSNPYKDITYYRLKQTDYDGNSEYLATIAVKSQKNFKELTISPNPVNNQADIKFNSLNNSETEFKIFDITGKLVYNQILSIDEGVNQFTLNTQYFNKGLYFLVVSNEFGTEKLKFVKE